MATTVFRETDLRLGRATALIGDHGGKYPHGNSLLVEGPDGVVLVDPSLSLVGRGGAPAAVDRVLVSHAHEDHLAGLHLFPDAAVQSHGADLPGLHSIDGLLAVYGMPDEMAIAWRADLLDQFHYVARPDATALTDGDRIELGGGTVVEVVHLAGHTRGHCGFLVDSEGVFFCADIDLTGFGPYYGDHWSDLDAFEDSIARCRQIDARWYVTFHHKGVVEGRADFVSRLDAFASVIDRRDAAYLAFLAEPRTLPDLVEHRFVYRSGVELLFADHVERRTATLHLERFVRRGEVAEVGPGVWLAV